MFNEHTWRFATYLTLATVALPVWMAGCEEPMSSWSTDRGPAPIEPITYVYPADPPVANADALANLMAGYRRQGTVVLLDVWATWCRPSLDRFPDMVELHRKYRDEGFQVIAVAFDNPTMWTVQIAPFLRSVRCGYPCALVPPSAQSDVVSRVGREWNGSVPARLIFDRTGRLVAELLDDQAIGTTDEVVRAILNGQYKPPESPGPRKAPGGVIARARTVDVAADKTLAQPTSRWSSISDIEAMAVSIAQQSEANIDWSKARVAVLPFTLVGNADSGAGKALADAVARLLAAKHPDAVVDRQEADDLLAREKLTPLGVEYDPRVIAGKANWTHIITGTLRWRP
jgi:thiol-disulfide isomerase/thioredoxin